MRSDMSCRWALGTALAVTAAAAAVAAPGAGAGSVAPIAQPSRATLSVTVRIKHLAVYGHEARASALATATLTSAQGTTTSTKQQVALSAATSAGCQVLHLYLQQLDLNLLGLVAMLDKVQLDVVGHAGGGVLGSLFCKLSRGVTGRIASVSTDRAINKQLAVHSPVLRFSAQLSPQTHATASQATPAAPGTAGATAPPAIAPGSCQVLNLILGPLNLTLLGLEVDLNQIHLDVTANPNGGALGSLFCSLSTAHLTV